MSPKHPLIIPHNLLPLPLFPPLPSRKRIEVRVIRMTAGLMRRLRKGHQRQGFTSSSLFPMTTCHSGRSVAQSRNLVADGSQLPPRPSRRGGSRAAHTLYPNVILRRPRDEESRRTRKQTPPTHPHRRRSPTAQPPPLFTLPPRRGKVRPVLSLSKGWG